MPPLLPPAAVLTARSRPQPVVSIVPAAQPRRTGESHSSIRCVRADGTVTQLPTIPQQRKNQPPHRPPSPPPRPSHAPHPPPTHPLKTTTAGRAPAAPPPLPRAAPPWRHAPAWPCSLTVRADGSTPGYAAGYRLRVPVFSTVRTGTVVVSHYSTHFHAAARCTFRPYHPNRTIRPVHNSAGGIALPTFVCERSSVTPSADRLTVLGPLAIPQY